MQERSRGVQRWALTWALLVVLAGLGVAGAYAAHRIAEETPAAPAKVPLKIDSNPAPVSMGDFKNGYSSILEPALAAVVNISSSKVVKQRNNFPGFFDDPFFRQFFGNGFGQDNMQPQTQREYSLGSGVIVNPNGYILTNNHVVTAQPTSACSRATRRNTRPS
jgi:S1-C subfamily serine protease